MSESVASASAFASRSVQCQRCGSSFIPPPSAEHKKFCTSSCRTQWWQERRRAAAEANSGSQQMHSPNRSMNLWFIRHIPSGGYLPEPTGTDGRGGSHTEPSLTDPPRVFRTERSARSALIAWLRGKVFRKYGHCDDGEYWEDVYTVRVPSRKKEEMEVVVREVVL